MGMLPLLRLLDHPPPRTPLGTFPSPVEEYPPLARELGFETLVVKREDRNASPLGGNKLRALEWILPAAGPAMLTLGGFGSTWCATLAHYAQQQARQVSAALFPQPWTDAVEGTLAVILQHAQVRLAPSLAALPWTAWRARRLLARQGLPVTWIPPGGASPLGILGSVNAALELAAQVAQGAMPRPDVVLVPLGTGGTAAGLIVGFDLLGWEVTVAAAGVTPRWIARPATVERHAERVRRLLARVGAPAAPRTARLLVLGTRPGAGYGPPTEQACAARARLASLGIGAELTYSARTFAALPALAGRFRRPCFWHTFDARLLAAPRVAADHPLLGRARARAEFLWPHPKSP